VAAWVCRTVVPRALEAPTRSTPTVKNAARRTGTVADIAWRDWPKTTHSGGILHLNAPERWFSSERRRGYGDRVARCGPAELALPGILPEERRGVARCKSQDSLDLARVTWFFLPRSGARQEVP
jgi:hypothetical protein